MKIRVQVPIHGAKVDIWKVITDIENSSKHIKGIEKIEILEKPDKGIIGLKWIETRTMFGKTATETMWITEAEENKYYKTRAESHGSVYISTVEINDSKDMLYLSMELSAKAISFGAKLVSGIFSLIFKNSSKKALLKDLNDIKDIVERK